ncbi:MAG TPA: multifunctional oxoglutarate decarboxylase/oxoglutarate dehydrogenase thiamine pyrophosphate-binding subunit/dihydrolipoyllysine-residue succinyltransferase subunit [Candidatus Acidoferrales bacterium]|nr:multifunctional oxoglutarate decarboxylase/oxoglutarate dehydrogenase thiamine pyrophosphate-binding subunit/dihydrolipoyllysine-residue succinyltransferase subunit [Candidatus Acidoferrales bacterium]
MADPVSLTLPAMGESVTEGIVSRWLKAVGDSVDEGEALVEVTTDKVDVEVPAPTTGELTEIVAAEGETVSVGAVLGRIAPGAAKAAAPVAPPAASANGSDAQPGTPSKPAEELSAAPADKPAAAHLEPPVAPQAASPAPGAETATAPPPALAPAVLDQPAPPVAPLTADGADVDAVPLARRAAARNGVDLRAVRGSGPGGIVTKGDVLNAKNGGGTRTDTTVHVAEGETAEPIRGPAAALVDYMERSRDIPTATSFRTIAVEILDARRRQINSALAAAGTPIKVSFTHLIGYAVARAAAASPAMTAHFARTDDGKPVRVPGPAHLGLAVDSVRKDGSRSLVVPVIRDAAQRPFNEFRAEYERLIERARTNSLSVDELQGATLTLTNPGGIGTVASVPRLMPGQGAIIAVGAIGYPAEWRSAPEASVGALGIGKVMTITSTYDHRVIQGAESGEFLRGIEALLGGAGGFYETVAASLGINLPPLDAHAPPPAMTSPPPAPSSTGPSGFAPTAPDRVLLGAMQAATSLVKAHRTHGHLGAHLDPLGSPPIGDPAMDPATYGLTPELMEQIPADLLRVYVPGRTLAQVLPNLRSTYCSTIAFEIEHLSSHEQRVWLREHIESGAYKPKLAVEDRLRLLERLTKVDAMERYQRATFLGQKTFSIEGLDALVPMLESLLTNVAADGIGEVVMGMSHRGRLAVVAHVANHSYESILNAFELASARRDITRFASTGDVKYHIGATGTYHTETGKVILVRLLPNPSHLEAIDPVVEGWCRAAQTQRRATTLHLDPMAALPVLIHGDAAFAGQGVVQEVMNLQSLPGYTTGGTVHFIADNQVGFTTDPQEGRSTRYASDLAKGFDIPIVHVNADDVEACLAAITFAYDYRRAYRRDVMVHLIGYRRFGHNEADEPAYTQPLMYMKIRQHPTVRELFAAQLTAEGLIRPEDVDAMAKAAYGRVADAHKRVKEHLAAELDDLTHEQIVEEPDDPMLRTAVSHRLLTALNEQLLTFPKHFTPNAKLLRQMERRRGAITDGAIDWGTAESLAFASLITQGHPIRLTGQDTVRGTFSHRHLAYHDERNGEVYIPMQHLTDAQATFEVLNSPLSEVGTLGFEYGYSAADPETLVVWEAQYGDFFNNAQMIVDQFISSARAKWGQHSRLTLLLPHGYEGSGPEHSSARIERFLQLCANDNMRLANCSTPSQYFHLLRSQGLLQDPRPLVVFTPKSLLRLKEATSTLTDLTTGRFQAVTDDPTGPQRRDEIRTLLLCTGRIYYELSLSPKRPEATDVAIGRVELLYPLPIDSILELVASYPNLERLCWVQEEPQNMGAWGSLERAVGLTRPTNVRWEYIGRPRRASPSEGYAGSHQLEEERIVNEAFATSQRGESGSAVTTPDSASIAP